MPTKTASVSDYLAGLSVDDRKVMSTVRDTIRKNLPAGYEEIMHGRFIAYVIPLSRLPKTYNGQPLWYIGLGIQKNYYTIHMLAAYMDPKGRALIEDGFKKAGKKLDMGKGCLRFKKIEDLPLDVIAKSVASVPSEGYVKRYESSRKK
jgi:uncharacterized protein DUF1801